MTKTAVCPRSPSVRITLLVLLFCLCRIPSFPLPAQTLAPAGNATQQLVFAGLRSVAARGRFLAVQSNAAGNLYLLLDQGDGVRLLETDSAATQVLAQAQMGAGGDAGTSLALDPAGNVYVTGTTSSTSFAATPGAAFPTRSGSSGSSFVARFTSALHPVFVTYTGGSRISAAAVAATADAVFVTGLTYASDLPVTPGGVQQAPAPGSTQSGFVERFSSTGALVYATYLTGALGSTTPTTVAADTSDHAYIAGSTTAPGFPTVAALVPEMISSPSGFLTRLTPLGDGLSFSTFIPGAGLTSIALDSTGQTLLATGSVALGQFPVDSVPQPLAPGATYQVLLRLPLNGSSVLSATALAPGSESALAAAPGGAAWVTGTLSAPLLPLTPLAPLGDGFAVRVTALGSVDQTARFGGLPTSNPSFASLPTHLVAAAVDPTGQPLFAGSVQPTASATLLGSETYDLPLRSQPTAALPSSLANATLAPNSCSGSLCAGSAAYLARLNPALAAPALSFSVDDAPRIILRNLGSADAQGLVVTATGASLTSTCTPVLAAGASCDLLLTPGSGATGSAGTITATAANSTPQAAPFPAFTTPGSTVVFSPRELDFGLESAVSPPVSRIVSVTNLGSTAQAFTSALDRSAPTGSPFSQTATDCPAGAAPGTLALAPGASCHLNLSFTPDPNPLNDGLLQADWTLAGEDILLTAASQAAALSVSSAQIDFGTQIVHGLRLPRFLYLSNNSSAAVAHVSLSLPASSPFTLADPCPSTLQPHSICRIRIDYLAALPNSTDSTVLTLDQGLSVLLTGQTLPPASAGGATVNPNLSVSPASLAFAGSTVVTAVSASAQNVTISNTGPVAFALGLALTGDFTSLTNCGSSLAAHQSCLVQLSFAPSQPGARQGLLAVSAGGGPVNVALSGSATPILNVPNGAIVFGSAVVGTPVLRFFKVTQPFPALNVSASGPYAVALIEDTGFGPGQPPASAFAPSLSAACHNCFLGVLFQPAAAGAQPGTLSLSSTSAATSSAGATYTVSLTGSGTPPNGLILTPAQADFGTIPQHSVGPPTLFTLTNLSSSGAAINLGAASLSGDFGLNSIATGGAACGGSLAYSASCLLEVDFAPTATGLRSGSLSFTASGLPSGSQIVQAALSGTGSADPGFALNPTALIFNNIPGTAARRQIVTVTNTGAAPLSVGPVSTAAPAFTAASTCATLAPAASCTLTVTFTPTSAEVISNLTLPITTPVAGAPPGASQPVLYTLPLDGAYTISSAGLQIVPGQASFGPAATQTEGPARQFTLNNLTSQPLAVAVALPRQFALLGPACTSVAANGSCSFEVEFVPLTGGAITGSLVAQASAPGTALSAITYLDGFGVGHGSLGLSGGLILDNVFNFNQVTSGQTSTQVFTLTNTSPDGSAPISIRRVSSEPPFLSTPDCPIALAPGDTCSVSVTYSPVNQVASGSTSPSSTPDAGHLVVESDAASSPDILNLAGQAGPLAAPSPSNQTPLATFSLSQSSLTFATTTVGNVSSPQAVTLTNTGTITLQIASLVLPPDFTLQSICATIAPGQTCTLTLTSTPQTPGNHFAALEIASNAAAALEFLSLTSTSDPSLLVLAPPALDFGSVLVGSSSTLSTQVTNTSASPVTFSGVFASGDFSAGGSCPAPGQPLAPGASCTVAVVFTPSATQTRTGILSIASSLSTLPRTVSLTGIGIQSRLLVTPSAVAFGSVVVGIGSNRTLTLENTGSARVSSLTLAASGDYAVSIPCAVSVLAPGQSCSVQITFTPTALGPRTGSLTLTSSDQSSPLAVPLTGTGIQNGGFTLTVDGGPASTVSVPSGQPATYHLLLTPTLGFLGAVALTCAPVHPAVYASCSISPSAITLAGAAQSSSATLMTLTSLGGNAQLDAGPALGREPAPGFRREPGPALGLKADRVPGPGAPPTITPAPYPPGAFLCLLLPGILTLYRLRRHLRKRLPLLLALLITLGTLLFASGCGSGDDPRIRYAPVGTYQYLVTASSTSGVEVSQTVTLNLTITKR